MISFMDSKKIFLWPVIISLVGHVALIAVSSMVDLREKVRAAELFTVQLTEPEPSVEPKQEQKEEKKAQEQKPVPSKEEKAADSEAEHEDTVDIGSSDIKYAAYLAGVKKKIWSVWKYDQQQEQGTVVIKFTIDASGLLTQAELTSSSGVEMLDQKTIKVIQTAAPFQPLPAQYDLSRLHIIASFRY